MSHPLVDELREVGRKARQQALLDTLLTVEQEDGEQGLRQVVREIAALGTRWKGLLAHLGSLDTTPANLQVLLRTTTDDRPVVTLSIRGRECGMLQNEVEGLQDRLARFHYAPKHHRLRIEFRNGPFPPFGIAVVMAWAAAHAPDAVWHFGGAENAAALNAMEFNRLVGGHDEHRVVWSPAANLGVLATPSSQDVADADRVAMAEELVQAITTGEAPLTVDAESRAAIARLIVELLDNIAFHAHSQTGGFILVSRRTGDHPAIRIVACDGGVGLKRSLSESGEAEVAALAEGTPAAMVKAATDPHVSAASADTERPGFGLFFVKRAATVTYGEMLIRSGLASYRIQHRMTASGRHRVEDFQYERSADWPGTFVAMQLAFDRPLQLDRALAAWDKAMEQRAAKAAANAEAGLKASADSAPVEAEAGADVTAATTTPPQTDTTAISEPVDEPASAAGTAASPAAAPTPAPAQPAPEVEELPAHRASE